MSDKFKVGQLVVLRDKLADVGRILKVTQHPHTFWIPEYTSLLIRFRDGSITTLQSARAKRVRTKTYRTYDKQCIRLRILDLQIRQPFYQTYGGKLPSWYKMIEQHRAWYARIYDTD